jgi:hypothetical protein
MTMWPDADEGEEALLSSDDEPLATGPCCACRREGLLRTVVMLPWRGRSVYGWGCVVCGLPPVGAIAILCDRCAAEDREPVLACAGAVGDPARIPLVDLRDPWEHDDMRHAGEAEETQ